MPAPDSIQKLVETFEKNLDAYHSSKNETELRREFLDKFFTALGWDVANEKSYDEARKEVVHEFSVEVAGQGKKADYAFRTPLKNAGQAGADKFDFLVEAKKPSVKIESSQDAAFQLRRYGWSAKLPINILTDFEHFAVYDCRAKPSYNDKASIGRIMLIHYKEYVERWDEIAAVFSLEAVRKGSFAKYTDGMKGKKGTADVDDAFLQEIERWRELLAKNIALRNEDVDIAGLNYAVQMIIDRIVFLRICEERGIEPENQLLDIATPPPPSLRDTSPKFRTSEFGGGRDGVYSQLCELFKRADTKYNSGLFHFKKEKESVSRPDDLTLSLVIDDKVLKDIISNLYYPKSPYAFLYIPTEILGQVYERFLGKVIRLTAGHQAKVEEKPEVRKAGGVYYTPTYIVDYIVKNTVGKLVENKTPKDVASLKLVDPACGSGTFLLGAYQFLLDWHLKWYVANEPEKWAQRNPSPIFALQKMGEAGRGYRLTTTKKKEILLNNIHGVDIDAQAVEVTKLSLLLKVLENASGQLGLGMERVLPDLGNNIKCGNSLIGFDYFEGQLMVNGEEQARVNPFDWESAFPEVFARGGFDAVVGNPPYGAEIQKSLMSYIRQRYETAQGELDSYVLFIEKSISLLRAGGLYGVILPDTWLTLVNTNMLRRWLLEKYSIMDMIALNESVFTGATVDPLVIIVKKQKSFDGHTVPVSIAPKKMKLFDLNILETRHEYKQSNWLDDNSCQIKIYITADAGSIIDRIHAVSSPLETFLDYRAGCKPYEVGKGFPPQTKNTLKEKPFTSHSRVANDWKMLIRGNDVQRYLVSVKKPEWIKYGNWLAAPRTPEIFKGARILIQAIRNPSLKNRIVAAFTTEDMIARINVYALFKKDDVSIHYLYLLGILNSRLTNWFLMKDYGLHTYVITGVMNLPIRAINFNDPAEKSAHDKIVSLVESMLALHKSLASAQSPLEKERLERQIKSTDGGIDSLVYALYGLTEEEIKIVEGK
jgi:hypothetical protein